jgi:cold shock CspA family protein
MRIDYGEIVKYVNKGFGFISRSLATSECSEVFFHISTLRQKYPELACRIDSGFYHGIHLWYLIETTEKGECAKNFWVHADELPFERRSEIVEEVMNRWSDISKPISSLLDKATIDLLGQSYRNELLEHRKCKEEEELQRRKEEQARIEKERRALQIQQICAERGIRHLVHFTHISNLDSILENGILGRSLLQELGIQSNLTDAHRIDGYPQAACLSISFPNYRMFYKYKGDSKDWIVLLLKADILWELDCAFCEENAASNNVRYVPLEDRKTPQALMRLFGDCGFIERRSLRIPDNYPTNPQAEVLVFDPISPQYIEEIHFEDANLLYKWKESYRGELKVKLVCDNRFFKYRQDYEKWKNSSYYDLPKMRNFGEECDPFGGC